MARATLTPGLRIQAYQTKHYSMSMQVTEGSQREMVAHATRIIRQVAPPNGGLVFDSSVSELMRERALCRWEGFYA